VTRKRKFVISFAAFFLVLIAARIALPYLVEDYANRKLVTLRSYTGHVGDVDIHLWRGAYSIDDVVIQKIGAKRPTPFFRTRRMDLSIEWRNLLRGSVVATARFEQPEVNLVQGKTEADTQLGKEEDWRARLEEFFPVRFNTVEVIDGTVRFLAPGISTHDAITARHVHGAVTNITNVAGSGRETFADFRLDGKVLDGAPAHVAGSVDPLAKQPTFDVNLEVKQVQLPQVNPWLREYIKADAEAGKFELYLEMAAADGKFKGYAKPILQDVDLHRAGEEDENALHRAWEGFLDFAVNVLTNPEADQAAARIPFTGTIKNPQTSLFATITSVLRNAFVSAFARSLEGSITLRDVKKNLNELDPDKESKEKKGKDGKDKNDKEKNDQDDVKADDAQPPKPPPGPAGKS
jgi:uncharacterized protein DUF748